MGHRIRRAGHSLGLHVRRQAIAYLALAVALGGSAYAGTKASSSKVGGKDLRPFVLRDGNLIRSNPISPARRRRSASGASVRWRRSGREACRAEGAP